MAIDQKKALLGLSLALGLVPSAQAIQRSPAARVSSANKAPETNAPAPKPKGGEGILDFEGEVIEGQRKRPDLFLQTEVQNLTLDAILYLRRDMNDFHQVERFRRPGYYERKTTREVP